MKNNKSRYANVSVCIKNNLLQNTKKIKKNNLIKDSVIYKIHMSDYTEIIDKLSDFLDSKETERANRYYKKKDKSRFIICRSLLKLVLSLHAKVTIPEIKIDYLTNKKPYLSTNSSIYFNVSHSENFGLIAISNCPVGIDIEFINPTYNFESLLGSVFNTNEITFIKNAKDKKLAFFNLWTRKEAFVKAIGKGIDNDFSKVPSLDGEHLFNVSFFQNEKNWKIQSFEVARNYIGAIAYEEKTHLSDKLHVCQLPNGIDDLLALLL